MANRKTVAMRFSLPSDAVRDRFYHTCHQADSTIQEEFVRIMEKAIRGNRLRGLNCIGGPEMHVRKIPADLRAEFKAHCARNGVPMRDAAAYLVSEYLNQKEKP